MSAAPVSEADLHAYVDAVLPPARAAEVEAYLTQHPEDGARVAAYREQIQALRRDFNAALEEPVPDRLRNAGRARQLTRYTAAAAVLLVVGGVIGWHLHAYTTDRRLETAVWARRAAIAH